MPALSHTACAGGAGTSASVGITQPAPRRAGRVRVRKRRLGAPVALTNRAASKLYVLIN